MTDDTTVFTDETARAVEQVCSSLYTQLFEQVAKDQPNELSEEQHILLRYYPNKISFYKSNQRPEMIERIRRTHLKWFNNWLKQQTGQPPYIKWNLVMDGVITHTTNLFFRIDLGDVITSNETRKEFLQIIDTVKSILVSLNQSNSGDIDSAAIPLVQILLLILFYFTLDTDLVIYLKNLQLVNLINDIIRKSNDDDEIHLQAYRILAVIMAEEDLKQLQNSNRIAAVFITFIKETIDGGSPYEARLHNSLRSLKVLTQHEQIREELIKQQGHTLFLRCALENQFNPIKAKLPALEILLALAFNKDFAQTLTNNQPFMDHIRTLTASSSSSSEEEELQKVATALIWKLEKETDNTTTKKTEDQSSPSSEPKLHKKQYDIMISYSHNDKELCHRILDVLEKDQLNVWIDSRLMHGATFDAMAKAIENAEFVLMCMSDAYKQSPFCEMEASYAIKRRCHIIPLVMTSNYKADGWLGVLTSALIYVDFPKLGFDKAYKELKRQIELIRTHNTKKPTTRQDQIQHNPVLTANEVAKPVPSVVKSKEPRPVIEYPHCIDMWNEEHVKSFLLDKELDVLLPVFEGLNGQLLHQAYSMCQSNQQGMYLSFKNDVAQSQLATLTLKDYLTFLKEIKVYIPYRVGNQLSPTSAVCNLM